MISRVDYLHRQLLSFKDVIIKGFQIENQRLRKKVNNLESKIKSLKVNYNSLEQYWRRNNINIIGISERVLGRYVEQRVEILEKIDVTVSPNNREACHCLCSSEI